MVTHLPRTAIRAACALAATAALAGCLAAPPKAARAAESPASSAAVSAPAGARRFDIDPAGTRVTMLVYRAGALARLGHNHAITSNRESGVIWLGGTPQSSGFEIHLPVGAFVVDDPAARAAAGPQFPGTVPEEARQGTLGNMLRPEVLDAARYPEIVVRSVRATGTWQQVLVRAAIRIKDTERELDVAVALDLAGDAVEASGAFEVRQSEFGITPFSVGGGAIQVADVVEVRFVIVGRARR